ncbi:MAG: thioredoxin-dependent thiol peroxidase [Candidatus Hydrogenedentes bacterium]|nr:thioredoxin-dependent thiol peroxidase [Candidatus Hydrogenedentota bacterium]
MTKVDSAIPDAGAMAPVFDLLAGDGRRVKLRDFKGRPVVIYFYPKDDTPGCTVEAKEFGDSMPEFDELGATVLGISPDNTASHCKFASKYDLTFPLLSDTEHAVAEKYGVWVEKSMYGRRYMGVQRATFLIDGAGRIAQAWPKVKPEGHAEQVLDAVRALQK